MIKIKTLQILLVLGAIYYIIGAIAHFFGLTIFPVYDHALYQPYHDGIIACSAILIALLMLTIARDPVKNIDSLNIVIIGGFIAMFFLAYFLLKIDFAEFGAPNKRLQSITEFIMLAIYIPVLIYLKPKIK